MALTNIFNISGSGMSAQTIRLNTVASNLANAQSMSSNQNKTYRAKQPVFETVRQQQFVNPLDMNIASQAGAGVKVTHIAESQAPLRPKYEPNHPLANDDGYIYYPNVNVVEEMANMISASRSFQMNVEVMNSAKTMMQRVLTLGQ